jgi:hypothetical protein
MESRSAFSAMAASTSSKAATNSSMPWFSSRPETAAPLFYNPPGGFARTFSIHARCPNTGGPPAEHSVSLAPRHEDLAAELLAEAVEEGRERPRESHRRPTLAEVA